jgi:hypothetical protein
VFVSSVFEKPPKRRELRELVKLWIIDELDRAYQAASFSSQCVAHPFGTSGAKFADDFILRRVGVFAGVVGS